MEAKRKELKGRLQVAIEGNSGFSNDTRRLASEAVKAMEEDAITIEHLRDEIRRLDFPPAPQTVLGATAVQWHALASQYEFQFNDAQKVLKDAGVFSPAVTLAGNIATIIARKIANDEMIYEGQTLSYWKKDADTSRAALQAFDRMLSAPIGEPHLGARVFEGRTVNAWVCLGKKYQALPQPVIEFGQFLQSGNFVYELSIRRA